jgi:hypothetical protein
LLRMELDCLGAEYLGEQQQQRQSRIKSLALSTQYSLL